MILVAESISQKGGSDHFWARQQQQRAADNRELSEMGIIWIWVKSIF
jgi:hypothetical protein